MDEELEGYVRKLEEWMVNGMTTEQKSTIRKLLRVDKDGKRLRAYIALEIGYAKEANRKEGERKNVEKDN